MKEPELSPLEKSLILLNSKKAVVINYRPSLCKDKIQ